MPRTLSTVASGGRGPLPAGPLSGGAEPAVPRQLAWESRAGAGAASANSATTRRGCVASAASCPPIRKRTPIDPGALRSAAGMDERHRPARAAAVSRVLRRVTRRGRDAPAGRGARWFRDPRPRRPHGQRRSTNPVVPRLRQASCRRRDGVRASLPDLAHHRSAAPAAQRRLHRRQRFRIVAAAHQDHAAGIEPVGEQAGRVQVADRRDPEHRPRPADACQRQAAKPAATVPVSASMPSAAISWSWPSASPPPRRQASTRASPNGSTLLCASGSQARNCARKAAIVG